MMGLRYSKSLQLKAIPQIVRREFNCSNTLQAVPQIRSPISLISSEKSFMGEQRVYKHYSNVCKCTMDFGIYLPPDALTSFKKYPVLYFLSGLSSDHRDFIQKSNVQKYAAKHNIIIVNPDTSPRDLNIPDDPNLMDLAEGASFYIDATQLPWARHFQMHSYITSELIDVVKREFLASEGQQSICGYSMGGHGALICSLKNPGLYKSTSVFAPAANIVNCTLCWTALSAFLGDDRQIWPQWDATCLAENYKDVPLQVLLDVGSKDEYEQHLMIPNFLKVSESNEHINVIYKNRDGYNHTYYYLSTFLEEHINYHAKFLNA